MQRQPKVYIIGGPNGAGKTTCAMNLLPELLECYEYVNADAIAQGLSPFRPAEVSIEAGRLMLNRIKDLYTKKVDFAFETTMASRSFVPFIKKCRESGYLINLLFIWLQSPELAVSRVSNRVKCGGHYVPDDIIIARYRRGLQNFFKLYLPLADRWFFYDNSEDMPVLIARRTSLSIEEVLQIKVWNTIKENC